MDDLYTRITREDVNQFFLGTLCQYNGHIVKCKDILYPDVLIVYLKTGKKDTVHFDPLLFKAPPSRIGMVNAKAGCVFVSRKPVRRFSIGISADNSTVKGVGSGPVLNSEIIRYLSTFDRKELFSAITNDYPSFEDACKNAIAANGTFAFDRQFAVDFDGNVYYRAFKAGKIDLKKELVVENIKFTQSYRHLLIGKKHETDSRNYRP